jgi:formate dehydrogenase maturation protein FdhE
MAAILWCRLARYLGRPIFASRTCAGTAGSRSTRIIPLIRPRYRSAPSPQSAAALSAVGGARWEEVLDEFWRAAPDAAPLMEAEALIAWTFLQPYAEVLAGRTARPDGGAEVQGTPRLCPLCYGRPLVGLLRPLEDGAKRSLVCFLCATEWAYLRIVCPACGEERVDKLPVYIAERAEELDYVRRSLRHLQPSH